MAGQSTGKVSLQNRARQDDGQDASEPVGKTRPAGVAPGGSFTPRQDRYRQDRQEQKRVRQRPRRGKLPRYGALDLGTNCCRLLIAVPTSRHFRVIDAFSRIVRLGEGVDKTGCMSAEAMDRALEALRICTRKLRRRGVCRRRTVVTHVCRRAENSASFIRRVRNETGLELEIIDQETEAQLAVASCAPLMARNAESVLLFDIGGGSSELVWLDFANTGCRYTSARAMDSIRRWVSIPVGVVSLSEHFGGHRISVANFESMIEETARHLTGIDGFTGLAEAMAQPHAHFLGTSGTVTTLGGIFLDLPRYDRRVIDGLWLSNGDVSRIIRHLQGMDPGDRGAHPCIGRERADLVLAGCAILEAIRRMWPCNTLRVADRGLREGMLMQLMIEDGFLIS